MNNRDREHSTDRHDAPQIEIITTKDPDEGAGRRRRALLGRLALVAGLAAGLSAGWLVLPVLLYGKQAQPLDFNHRVHAESASMSCEDCHGFGEDGSFAGIPSVKSCADCHAEAQGDSPAERTLVDEYVTPGREIPWRVYARQPDNVYFSHAAHVRRAQIECRRCHGDRGESATAPVYQFNRISTYSRNIWGPRISGGGPHPWDSMKMSDCCGCHAERGVRDHCLMCHK